MRLVRYHNINISQVYRPKQDDYIHKCVHKHEIKKKYLEEPIIGPFCSFIFGRQSRRNIQFSTVNSGQIYGLSFAEHPFSVRDNVQMYRVSVI